MNWKCGLFRIIWNIELTVCPFYYPQTTLGNLTMCILAKGLFHLVSRNADTFWSSVQVRDILETLLINQGQLKSIMFLYLVSVMLTSVICTSCIAPSPLTIAILVTLVQLVFSLSLAKLSLSLSLPLTLLLSLPISFFHLHKQHYHSHCHPLTN